MTAPKRSWFPVVIPALFMFTLFCGLGLLVEELVNVRVRPAFLADVLLTPEELADESFRDRALELFDRAAESQNQAKHVLAITLGAVGTAASLGGLVACYRKWM